MAWPVVIDYDSPSLRPIAVVAGLPALSSTITVQVDPGMLNQRDAELTATVATATCTRG